MILLAGLAGCNSGYHPKPASEISVSPTSATAGSPDLTLTITGSNGQQFQNATHNRSQAFWSVNGTEILLATSFVSSTMLSAVVPAALLSNPVTAQVLVETGDPEGSLPLAKSNAVSFSVTGSQGQVVSKISVSPTSAMPDSPDLTLTITATDGQFSNANHNRSRAVWSVNGSEHSLPTTFVNSTTLTAVVPAALLSNPVTAQVLVETGDPVGSLPLEKSNSVDFIVGGPT
jgi:hypothetical protein